ncbi:hypothetical protein ACQPXH_20910 [Nocardia sp. CA-135953]|uniref:hypothetical protein n=1 Tax=Nocardia sp. CA-135953 TaxID=3239978 RepID=UPI003D9886F6
MPAPVEPIPPEQMLGESDWDDEDLLTISEASERLAMEVRLARERAQRASESLVADPDGPDSARLRAEVAAEQQRAEELKAAADRILAAHASAPGPT